MRNLDDQLLDKLIQSAGYQLLEESAGRAPAADDLSDVDTCVLDDQFAKVLRRCRRKERLVKTRRIVLRISAVVLAVIFAFGIALASSEALRVRILNMIYSSDDIATDIQFETEETEGATPSSAEGPKYRYVEPSYIPEGYVLTELIEMRLHYASKYRNTLGNEFEVLQLSPNASLTIDSEDRNVYEIEIEGRKALISEGKGWDILVYTTGEFVFCIQGNAGIETLKAVAAGMAVN